MKPLAMEEIRQAVHGRWVLRGAVATVEGVTTDSRTAGQGELFVALGGQRFDGHAFLAKASQAGCIAAIVKLGRVVPEDLAALFGAGVIGVADTTAALGELAGYHRGLCSATVVAVTGSNGKTTVKRMIHHILSKRLAGSCSPKSFNNNIGVPLTLLGVSGKDDYVVCELGSNAPGEIAALTRIARPDIAVITSVAETHLEKLGSLQRVAAEKASVLGALTKSGLAVVWGDSNVLDKALKAYDARIIRFGALPACELRLTDYQATPRGQRFRLNGRLWVELPLRGRHNAVNALAAIAVAQRMGLPQDDAAAALADFAGPEMRLEPIDAGGVTIINDAYNANPASVVAAADVLAESDGRRRVLIVGDMRELGAAWQELHLRTGREIASRKLDLLIGVGQMGRYIASGAAEEGQAIERFESVEAAASGAAGMLRRGDVVLIKGSRAMAMERLIEPIRQAMSAPRAAAGPKKGRTP